MSRRVSGSDDRPLSIGALSRATQIPVETLRTWERRYGSPQPIRKPSGHRLYAASTVQHLRRIGRLLAQGHRPADILPLPDRELDALLALSPSRRDAAPMAAGVETPERSPEQSVRKLVENVTALDRTSLLNELRGAWVRLGPIRFLAEVAGPFMMSIGDGWQAGSLQVRHEHFASACLSDFLRAAREPYDQRAQGPSVVAAMLPGERHEGGLLIVSTLLAVRGRRVLYLGAETPVDQIAAAAASHPVEAVVVSLSAAMVRSNSRRALARLREQLPSRVGLWTGGAGAPPPVPGIHRFESLAALDARLERAG